MYKLTFVKNVYLDCVVDTECGLCDFPIFSWFRFLSWLYTWSVWYFTQRYIHMLFTKTISSSFYTHSSITFSIFLPERHGQRMREEIKFPFPDFNHKNVLTLIYQIFSLRLEVNNIVALGSRCWRGQTHKIGLWSLNYFLEDSYQLVTNTHFEFYMKKKIYYMKPLRVQGLSIITASAI